MFSLAIQDLLESSRPIYAGDAPMSSLENYYNLFHNRAPRAMASKSDKFQVHLNVKHFTPDEINVKTVDNYIVVHCKHEEHADEHGLVSREFTRRYRLPEDVEVKKTSSALSNDGVLTIEAPRKVPELPPNERVVPVTSQRPATIEQYQKMQGQRQLPAQKMQGQRQLQAQKMQGLQQLQAQKMQGLQQLQAQKMQGQQQQLVQKQEQQQQASADDTEK